jgi:hypothetical protein
MLIKRLRKQEAAWTELAMEDKFRHPDLAGKPMT